MASVDLELDGDNWSTRSDIKFSLATLNDIDDLKRFMSDNYYANAPIIKCVGASEGNVLIGNYVRRFMDKICIYDPIQKNESGTPCSIIVRTVPDNRIVACNMGAIYKRDDIIAEEENSFVDRLLEALPSYLFPRKLMLLINVGASLFADLKYSKKVAFEELKDSGDLIYFDECLSVSNEMRGQGLGRELVKRAYKIAQDAGCKYTYVLATSIYSQKIFHKLDNTTVLHEVQYEDYEYDKDGRPFLLNYGEHRVIQILAINHTP